MNDLSLYALYSTAHDWPSHLMPSGHFLIKIFSDQSIIPLEQIFSLCDKGEQLIIEKGMETLGPFEELDQMQEILSLFAKKHKFQRLYLLSSFEYNRALEELKEIKDLVAVFRSQGTLIPFEENKKNRGWGIFWR